MRVLLFPPVMRIGGSQLYAVEVAEQLHHMGHDVLVFSEDGPLRQRVEDAGIAFATAPTGAKLRPWPANVRRLADVARGHRADVVHAFEWPPILEAAYGPSLRHGIPVVGTVMSMGVAPFIPRHVPLVVGTRQIARGEAHRPWVEVIEPPVDVERNCPGAGGALQALVPDLRHEDLLVVVVSRLADALKREGILAAIDAVGALSRDLSIRLLIVGDGPARPEIEAAAAAQNAVAGRPVVTLTGGVMDPRPAYDAADIVLGMGSSALRGMAFAKPLVVQGERGFWRLLEPDSLGEFLEQGWYGIGDGQDGSPALQQILRVLHGDPARRERLGAFSRSVVLDRFSLGAAVERHEAIYAKAVSAAPSRSSVAAGALGPLVHAVAHELRSYVAARRGQPVTEDFNAISAQAGSHRTTQALNK